MEKKKAEPQVDPHAREAHIAESFEKHAPPSDTPLTVTGIPMQVVAPIPGLTPTPVFKPSVRQKKELTEIEGIDEKIAAQMRELGINDMIDLAEASDKDLAENLKLPLETIRKWIQSANEIRK